MRTLSVLLLNGLLAAAFGQGGKAGVCDWGYQRIKPQPSAAWLRKRSAIASEVAATKSMVPAKRYQHLLKVSSALVGERPSADATYRAAAYWLAFRNEWSTALGGDANRALTAWFNSEGDADPEYCRVVYKATCLAKNVGPWKAGTGRRLMEVFPWDAELKTARVYEASCGNPPVSDLNDAIRFLDEDERMQSLDRLTLARRRAGVYHNLYSSTKSKKALDLAIDNYEYVASNLRDPEIRQVAKSWADVLKKNLSQGQFKRP